MRETYAGRTERFWLKMVSSFMDDPKIAPGAKMQKAADWKRVLEVWGDWDNFPQLLKNEIGLWARYNELNTRRRNCEKSLYQ